MEASLRYEPDVVLLDIGMPQKGGIDALKEIKAALPKTKVAMLTTFEDDESIRSAVFAGC